MKVFRSRGAGSIIPPPQSIAEARDQVRHIIGLERVIVFGGLIAAESAILETFSS
jgi:hypothetical protein